MVSRGGKGSGTERRMSFFEHLEEFRDRMKRVLLVTILFFAFFLVFSLQYVSFSPIAIPLPVPAFLFPDEYGIDPIASQVFRFFVNHLKPENVTLTAKQPWEGVLVQIKTGFFLALIASSPVSAWEFAKFIGPALKPAERRLIFRVATPVLLLFLAGVLVAFLFVLPFTFDFLYSVQAVSGVELYLLFIDDFVTFVLVFLVAFGLAFELPILMYALSAVGMVDSGFWKRNWRYAAIAIFIFGAVITPDGSGVTMMIVAMPMFVLYVIGYAAVLRREKRASGAKSS